MLPLLLEFLRWYKETHGSPGDLGALRVLNYITVRAGLALMVSFMISLAIGPWVINRLRELKAGQVIRKAYKSGAISLADMHGKKAGTPTMGGLLILASTFGSSLIFCRVDSLEIGLLIAMSLGFGALGFWDDFTKVMEATHYGVSARGKLAAQAVMGLFLGVALWVGRWDVGYIHEGVRSVGYSYLLLPFFKDIYPYLGLAFVVWAAMVMMSASNAVNLTDGLDGLAIGVTLTCALSFTTIAYLSSRVDMSQYLFIPHIPAAGEIAVFGGALIGGALGFLWFNAHPAQVFMGDTGSMMLGGALGTMALLLKQELLLLVVGGVFVAETVSVMIQVTSFKLTGKRVFLMSPLHHHFEKKGLHENKIIIRFWTISLLLALFGLATLKLR